MTTLNERATAVFRRLIDGLTAIGHHTTHDNAHGRFMALHAEVIAHDRLGPHAARIVSLAHYYEQNGDLVCDPDDFQVEATGRVPRWRHRRRWSGPQPRTRRSHRATDG